jgi:hypothetical protein
VLPCTLLYVLTNQELMLQQLTLESTPSITRAHLVVVNASNGAARPNAR